MWISRSAGALEARKQSQATELCLCSGGHGVTTEPGDMGFHPGSAIAQQ